MRISDWSSDVCSSDLAYSGSSLGQPVADRLTLLGLPTDSAQTIGFVLVIGLVTYASLIVGELVPKQFALHGGAITDAIDLQVHGVARRHAFDHIVDHVSRHRSEERRVGEECVRPGSSRCSQAF